MLELLKQPWPWYVGGLIVGLTVPALLLLGNKPFGISSNLRHICAACVPANIPFFQYNWKKELWNLFFIAGIAIGAFIAQYFLYSPEPSRLSEELILQLQSQGITDFDNLLPPEIFSWENLFTLKSFIFIVGGGFLVGFGTRYAAGCTSGHSIMGLSNLQWPSLVATISFMAGGLVMTHFILPYLLKL